MLQTTGKERILVLWFGWEHSLVELAEWLYENFVIDTTDLTIYQRPKWAANNIQISFNAFIVTIEKMDNRYHTSTPCYP